MSSEEVTFKFILGRFALITLIFGGILGIMFLIAHLYSLTPEYEQSQIDYKNKIDSMTCAELLTEIENSVPHGFTVGAADIILDRHIAEFREKDCLK